MATRILEVCCGSVDDAVEAERGGAHRIELCSALHLGGLTPSLGTLAEARLRTRIPIMAMVRPRTGGFCYTAGEMAAMEFDAELLLAAGADGIVFGVLGPNGYVDILRTRRLREVAGKKETVFHRAFDHTPDPIAALDQLAGIGITRVLTSGQSPSTIDGLHLIRRLVEHAKGRIEILAGGGIRPEHVALVLEETGVNQVHLAAGAAHDDRSCAARPLVRFNGAQPAPECGFNVTDASAVAQAVKALQA